MTDHLDYEKLLKRFEVLKNWRKTYIFPAARDYPAAAGLDHEVGTYLSAIRGKVDKAEANPDIVKEAIFRYTLRMDIVRAEYFIKAVMFDPSTLKERKVE